VSGPQETWLTYVAALSDREDRRKAALEARATGLAALSASVIALLTVGSTISARAGIPVSSAALDVVAVALFLFVASIICAIVANIPLRTRQADPLSLLSNVRLSAELGDADAWKTIVSTHIADYTNLFNANRVKAIALWGGLSFQILGCIALSAFILINL